MPQTDWRGQEFTVPDAIEPIIAWRGWYLYQEPATQNNPYNLRWILSSHTYYTVEWTPREPLRAVCIKTTADKHYNAPVDHCTCGVYGVKDAGTRSSANRGYFGLTFKRGTPRSGRRMTTEQAIVDGWCWHIVGRVKLWGRVCEGVLGYRGEFAYPESFYVPDMSYEPFWAGSILPKTKIAWEFKMEEAVEYLERWNVPINPMADIRLTLPNVGPGPSWSERIRFE